MRLIDADALLHEIEEEEKKRIDKLFDTSCLKKKLNDFTDTGITDLFPVGVYRLKKYINDLPKLGGTKWISIKKELPNDGQNVVIVTKEWRCMICHVHYPEEPFGKLDPDPLQPMFGDDSNSYLYSVDDVKYWMPLPDLTSVEEGTSEKQFNKIEHENKLQTNEPAIIKWIRTKNALPPNCMNVLIVTEDPYTKIHFKNYAQLRKEENNEAMFISEGGCAYPIDEVKFWAPFPKLPEGCK